MTPEDLDNALQSAALREFLFILILLFLALLINYDYNATEIDSRNVPIKTRQSRLGHDDLMIRG